MITMKLYQRLGRLARIIMLLGIVSLTVVPAGAQGQAVGTNRCPEDLPPAADGYEPVFADCVKIINPIKPQWHSTTGYGMAVESAPNGEQYLNTTEVNPSLQLHNIPQHTKLRISFDLLTVYQWSGHQFRLSTTDQVLLQTTFSNTPNVTQDFPIPNVPAQTGAVLTNTLGYEGMRDATYRITITLDHVASDITFFFKGPIPGAGFYPYWGIDNVAVELFNPAPPRILSHPSSQSVGFDCSAIFMVAATGARPLTYQWYRLSRPGPIATPIPGATQATYIIPQATANDSGQYYVVVSNPFGSTISNWANLILYADPEPACM